MRGFLCFLISSLLIVSHLSTKHVSLSTFWVRVVQFLSPVWHLVTPWTATHQAVFCYLLEFAQTHVHWVGDTIQPSHPLSSPSPPASSLSQHQGLFQWVGSSHQVAKVLELQLQQQSFQWLFRVDFLQDWLVCSPCCPRNSQGSSPAPQFRKHQFFGVLPPLSAISHNPM